MTELEQKIADVLLQRIEHFLTQPDLQDRIGEYRGFIEAVHLRSSLDPFASSRLTKSFVGKAGKTAAALGVVAEDFQKGHERARASFGGGAALGGAPAPAFAAGTVISDVPNQKAPPDESADNSQADCLADEIAGRLCEFVQGFSPDVRRKFMADLALAAPL